MAMVFSGVGSQHSSPSQYAAQQFPGKSWFLLSQFSLAVSLNAEPLSVPSIVCKSSSLTSLYSPSTTNLSFVALASSLVYLSTHLKITFTRHSCTYLTLNISSSITSALIVLKFQVFCAFRLSVAESAQCLSDFSKNATMIRLFAGGL